jgi:hypothetical protein
LKVNRNFLVFSHPPHFLSLIAFTDSISFFVMVKTTQISKTKGFFFLGPFTSNALCKLDIPFHNGHTVRVDGTQVRILKQPNQVGFRSFLQSSNSRRLEAEIPPETRGNLTNESLKWQLSDEEICGLLVFPDFSEGHSTRPETMLLFGTLGVNHRCGLAGSFGTQGLAWGFTTGGLPSCLLGSSHEQVKCSIVLSNSPCLVDFLTICSQNNIPPKC